MHEGAHRVCFAGELEITFGDGRRETFAAGDGIFKAAKVNGSFSAMGQQIRFEIAGQRQVPKERMLSFIPYSRSIARQDWNRMTRIPA